MTFALHPQLTADTIVLGDLALSRLLLMNDARYPWLVLVPRRTDCVEIVDLDAADRAALMEEIARSSTALKQVTAAEKLNIGAIGNKVSQLHVHVVARFEADAAWPEPVWGRGSRVAYDETQARQRATAILTALGLV